jgi:hypothetical protein
MNFRKQPFSQLLSKSFIDPTIWQKQTKSGHGYFKAVKLDPKETIVVDDISDCSLIDNKFRFLSITNNTFSGEKF